MKSSNLFAVLSIIALLLISQGATIVHAQTLTKDFGVQNEYDTQGYKTYSYDVTATIETEPNGDWISGKTYEIDWVITLTYLNQSIFGSSSNFYINFYEPELVAGTMGNGPSGVTKIVTNETNVSLQQESGTLSMTFTAGSQPMNYEILSSIWGTEHFNTEFLNGGTQGVYWEQSAPIWISIVNNQTESATSLPMELFYAIVIAVVIVAVGIGAYAYGKRKK